MKVLTLDDAVKADLQEMFKTPVVIPTETVYGLSARIDCEYALDKIFEIKGRPKDNPLIVHISSYKMLYDIIDEPIPPLYQKLMDKFWPGPFTLLFKVKSNILKQVRGNNLDTVAIRMPYDSKLRLLIERLSVPLAAPSANTSGKPSPTTLQHVIDDLGNKVEYYIDGGVCSVGLESTLFAIIDKKPVLLRPGIVTREQIEEVIELPVFLKTKVNEKEIVLCPGQKYKHYSPSIPVILFRSNIWKDEMLKLSKDYKDKKLGVMCFSNNEINFTAHRIYDLGTNLKEYASRVFAGLRSLDLDCDIIFIQGVDSKDEGLAIMDRLEKASSRIID